MLGAALGIDKRASVEHLRDGWMNRAVTLQPRPREIMTEAADLLTEFLHDRESVDSMLLRVEELRSATPQENTQSHRTLAEIRDGLHSLLLYAD